jgi:hypothetical protein
VRILPGVPDSSGFHSVAHSPARWRRHAACESNRNAREGTRISNRAPAPGSPVSVTVIPVIARISRIRKSPNPVFFPTPRAKIRSFSVAGTDRKSVV